MTSLNCSQFTFKPRTVLYSHFPSQRKNRVTMTDIKPCGQHCSLVSISISTLASIHLHTHECSMSSVDQNIDTISFLKYFSVRIQCKASRFEKEYELTLAITNRVCSVIFAPLLCCLVLLCTIFYKLAFSNTDPLALKEILRETIAEHHALPSNNSI